MSALSAALVVDHPPVPAPNEMASPLVATATLHMLATTGQLLPVAFLFLLINSHHLEPKTSGGGGELRIVGQQ